MMPSRQELPSFEETRAPLRDAGDRADEAFDEAVQEQLDECDCEEARR